MLVRSVVKEDKPYVLFHATDNPYIIQSVEINDDWTKTQFGEYSCVFQPKDIKLFQNQSIAIIYSGIASSICDISNLPDTIEEKASTRFPFAIDDLTPSLFSTEFAYASSQRCSIYSLSKECISRNLEITSDILCQPTEVSLQPSSHPLIYYISHENGIYSCDFRMKKATLISKIPHCSFLQRMEEDWNHYCFSHDGEIDLIDIRNPQSLEMSWHYAVLTAKIIEHDCYQVLGGITTRSFVDLSSSTSPHVIPSQHNESLQLLAYSPKQLDYSILPLLRSSSNPLISTDLCTMITYGWNDNNNKQLNLSHIGLNNPMRHLFVYESQQRQWTIPYDSIPKQQSYLRCVDIDKIIMNTKEDGDNLEALEHVIQQGILAQPQSIQEIYNQVVAKEGKHIKPELILKWLRDHHYKEITSISNSSDYKELEGIVFVDEAKYADLFNLHLDEQHPLDKKRIDTLSNIWDHKESDNTIII